MPMARALHRFLHAPEELMLARSSECPATNGQRWNGRGDSQYAGQSGRSNLLFGCNDSLRESHPLERRTLVRHTNANPLSDYLKSGGVAPEILQVPDSPSDIGNGEVTVDSRNSEKTYA